MLGEVLANQMLQRTPVRIVDLGHIANDFFHDPILQHLLNTLQPRSPPSAPLPSTFGLLIAARQPENGLLQTLPALPDELFLRRPAGAITRTSQGLGTVTLQRLQLRLFLPTTPDC